MKKISIFLITLSLTASAVTANAAPVPKESLPCYATTEQVTVTENLISGILEKESIYATLTGRTARL